MYAGEGASQKKVALAIQTQQHRAFSRHYPKFGAGKYASWVDDCIFQ